MASPARRWPSEWPFDVREEVPRLQGPLGGYIFVCSAETAAEYLQRKLFGLSRHYIDSVKEIRKGLPLFLYNCSTKLLHGIYEAASDGGMNLEPSAWSTAKFGRTLAQATSRFPAQVRVRIREKKPALEDEVFRPVLFQYSEKKFRLPLSPSEVAELLKLFQYGDSTMVETLKSSRRYCNGCRGDSPWRKGSLLRLRGRDKENAARKRSAETFGSQSPYSASDSTRNRQGRQGTSPSERSRGSSEAGENKYLPRAYSFISLRTGVCTMLDCKTKLLPPECVQVWEKWKNDKAVQDEAAQALATEIRVEPEAGGSGLEKVGGASMIDIQAIDVVDKQEPGDELQSPGPVLKTAVVSVEAPVDDAEALSSASEEVTRSEGTGLRSKLETTDTESPPLGPDKQEFARQLPDFNVGRHAMFGELIQEICRAEDPSSRAGSSSKPVKPARRKEQELSPYRVLFQDRNRHLLREVLASLSQEAKLIKEAWDNSKQMCALEEADRKIAAKGTEPLSLYVSLKDGVVKKKENQKKEEGEMLASLMKPEMTTGFYIKVSEEELQKKLPSRNRFPVKTRDQQVKEHLLSLAGEGVGIVGRQNAM